MYSRDELFLRSRECYFGVYFPCCFATREINTKMKGQSEIAYLPKFANMMLIVMVIVITEILYIILIFDCFAVLADDANALYPSTPIRPVL